MRYAYFHRHPRNFANECSMLKASTKEQIEDLEAQGYERLSVAEAKRHLAWINAENSAWGSNRAVGVMRFTDVMSVTDFRNQYS